MSDYSPAKWSAFILVSSLFTTLALLLASNTGLVSLPLGLTSPSEKNTLEWNPQSNYQKTILLQASKKAVHAFFEKKPIKIERIICSNKRVYVTLREKGELVGCQANLIDSNNLALKTAEATLHALTDPRFKSPENEESTSIEINVLNPVQEIKDKSIESLKKEIEPGIHGIKIENNNQKALFLPTVMVQNHYSHKRMIQEICKKAGMKENCLENPQTKIYKFTTTDFTSVNGNLITLYRGNPLIKNQDISTKTLKHSVELTRDWFKANNDTNGLYYYEYYPAYNRFSKKNSLIRQFGSLGTAARIAHFLNDKELEKTCQEKAKEYTSALKKDNNKAWVNEGKKSKLGTSALLLIALLELNDKNQFSKEIEQLANFIQSMQTKNGAFYTHYPKSTDEKSIDYYPGEALLALMLAFEKTGKKEYLQTVEKAFPNYKKYFDANKNTAFVPWQSSAYSHAFLATRKKEYAEFVFEMNDWILKKQYNKQAPYPDYAGGFAHNSIPGASTCSYSEGLADALSIAKKIGEDKSKKYSEALKKAARFMLQLQFNEKNTYYIKQPKLAIGGFKKSLANETIRVDNQQHCASAILKLIKLNN